MSISIKEAVETLKQKARKDAKLFFEEFRVEFDPTVTDWDSAAFHTSFEELAFDTQDALLECSDYRPFISTEDAIERNEFSDSGYEVYQTELVTETRWLAGLE